MLFTSLKFLLFILIVFLLYWFVFKNNYKQQNVILLIASYVFYGIAEWKMLPLLVVTTLIFYILTIGIHKAKTEKAAGLLTTLGVVIGVGILLYFKYFNFFIQSFSDFFSSIGLQTNWHTFKIIMPLGVSYFTFKLISYVVEVHRGKMEPCRDFIAFSNYVAFFPTIMSGPIDRPNKFINQLEDTRIFNSYFSLEGVQQFLWGLFKKAVIADNIAVIINPILNDWTSATGSSLLIATLLYVFQMYADFSGYSDMAIGVGKILGLRITANFRYPFFATNVAEFWRRWHISLTSWVTDYVFTPLNIKFRDMGNWGMYLAILINMVIIGLWHGANWTYAVFGVYQSLFFIPLIVSGKMNKRQKLTVGSLGLPSMKDVFKMLYIFLIYAFGTILFRASDLKMAWGMTEVIFSTSLFEAPALNVFFDLNGILSIVFILFLVVVEWINHEKEFPMQFNTISYEKQSWLIIMTDLILLMTVYWLGNTQGNTFIYYQF